MSAISITISLFVILNSLGNIPIFIAVLKNFDLKRQRVIIMREMVIALFIMLLFWYFGDEVLSLLHINIPIFRVGGGVLLSFIAMSMIFPKPFSAETLQQEPFIVPLATPIMTGPGTISSIIIFSQEQSKALMLLCIVAAWIPSLIALLLASFLKKILGEKVLFAFERLAGMLLFFIAIQMFTTGLREYVETL